MANRQIRRKRRNAPSESSAFEGLHGSSSESGTFGERPADLPTGDSTADDNGATVSVDDSRGPSRIITVNPADGYSGAASGGDGDGAASGRRRRSDSGKRRGTRTRKADSETTKTLAELLYGLHYGLSVMAQAEEFGLTSEESEKLAESVTRVSQFYDVSFVSEKTAAWIGLLMCCATLYGPRMLAFNRRVAEEKKAKQPKVQVIGK